MEPSAGPRRPRFVLAAITAVVAGSLIANDSGVPDRWRAVIVLWAVAPSFVAWSVVHASRLAGARVPVLWLAVFPAALAALLSYLVLAPSLVLLVIAAVRASFGGLPRDLGPALRGIAGGLLFVAGWAGGLLVLFAFDDERCLSTALSTACASDVVTTTEAGLATALLGAAVLAVLALARER